MSKFFKNLKKSLISTKRKIEFSKECLKKYPTILFDLKTCEFTVKWFIENALRTKGHDEKFIKLFFDKIFVEITEDILNGDLNGKIEELKKIEELNGDLNVKIKDVTRREFINKLYDFLVDCIFI